MTFGEQRSAGVGRGSASAGGGGTSAGGGNGVGAGVAQWDQCRSAPSVAWIIWDPRGSGSREEADWVEVGGWKKMPDSGLGRRSVGLVWFGWVGLGLVWFGLVWFGLGVALGLGLVSAGLWVGFGVSWCLGFRPGNFLEDNRSGCLSYSSLS